jgi:adenylate cyclase
MRLTPLDPQGYLYAGGLAHAHLAAGRYEEAIEWADRSLSQQPRYTPANSARTISCAHLGRIKEAQDYLRRRLELQPGLTIAKYQAYLGQGLAPEVLAMYVEGFRKAGLPEE